MLLLSVPQVGNNLVDGADDCGGLDQRHAHHINHHLVIIVKLSRSVLC